MGTLLEYYINLDERGEFRADVRRDGVTIWETEGYDVFDDGFMRHKSDMLGLFRYLISLGLATDDDDLVHMN